MTATGEITYLFSLKDAELHRQASGYTICVVDAGGGYPKLTVKGYRFADRTFHASINLVKWDMQIKLGGKEKYRYTVGEDWDVENVYGIASHFFQNDCRFAVDPEDTDHRLKNKILKEYICQLSENGYSATCCFTDRGLAGFNLWKVEAQGGKIFLGAVRQEYLRTGTAVFLYGETLRAMREKGALTLTDQISTANLPSINLHIRLAAEAGIRFTRAEDWYIKKWH